MDVVHAGVWLDSMAAGDISEDILDVEAEQKATERVALSNAVGRGHEMAVTSVEEQWGLSGVGEVDETPDRGQLWCVVHSGE